MEGIERRSESPSTRASSRLSNLSNQDLSTDSDMKDPTPKKRSASSKRKNRNSDKENGDVNLGTNGDVHVSDEQTSVPQSGDKTEMKEVNVVNDSEVEENGNENGDENNLTHESSVPPEGTYTNSESNGDIAPELDDKSVNGDAYVDVTTSENAKEIVADGEGPSPKGPVNETGGMDTEESCVTASTECVPMERAESGELSPKDANSVEDNGNVVESDQERENGFEGGADLEIPTPVESIKEVVQAEKMEPRTGFFGKWTFGRGSDKKEPETNGLAEDVTSHLYFSSIKGRVPLSRASPSVTLGETGKNSALFCKGMKTPNSNTRTLDDSFGVKSEPSRLARGESKERPNLRKFPAKRCLNAEESDEKDDSFLSNLTFTKRRKLEDDKTRTGFLRSFLWSPFRKRSVSGSDEVHAEEAADKGAVAKSSWFRSPFWFWKRCNREEERN